LRKAGFSLPSPLKKGKIREIRRFAVVPAGLAALQFMSISMMTLVVNAQILFLLCRIL
jgi:hypothetical protein